MPTSPPHPCAHCGRLLARGQRCTACMRRFDRTRPEHFTFYTSSAWRALRAQVLAEEPSCPICRAPTTEVDHLITRRLRPDLELVRANLRALCKACHSTKTRREQ